MILSFHPCFVGDENRLCAGRQPDQSDRELISMADAVILPQGPPRRLYEIARENCRHVFPNYDARFRYPGKIGQIRLFRKIGATHPETLVYKNIGEYPAHGEKLRLPPGFTYPCMFKFDWGGEGDNIIFIRTREDLAVALKTAEKYEKTGQKGFLVQSYIPSAGRCLRVVAINQKMISYWKIQKKLDRVCAGVTKGAMIDPNSDPDSQHIGVEAVKTFCRRTGINLAGFDLLFPENKSGRQPLFLEINYFFGRKGLGGSERFYQQLVYEILNWIDQNGLPRPNCQLIENHEQI